MNALKRFINPIMELQIITKHKVGNSLVENAEEIIKLIDMIINDFFIPYNKKFCFSLAYSDNTYKILDYTEKNWNKIKSKLLSKTIDTLSIEEKEKEYIKKSIHELGYVENNPYWGKKKTFELYINFELWDNNHEFTYNKIRFYSSLDLLNLENSQEKWVKLLLDYYVKFNGVSALMNISGANLFSKCETDCESLIQQTDSVSLRERLEQNIIRGGFWGNVWTEQQVEMLGGTDEIKEEVEPYEIIEIENNNGKHYYIQLTADIFETDYQKQKRIYKFLIKKDVLPKQNPELRRGKNYLGTYEEYREELRKVTDFYDIYEEITGERLVMEKRKSNGLRG